MPFIRIVDLLSEMMVNEEMYSVWSEIRKKEFGFISHLSTDLKISLKDINEYVEIFKMAKLIVTTRDIAYAVQGDGFKLTKAICALTDHVEDYKYG